MGRNFGVALAALLAFTATQAADPVHRPFDPLRTRAVFKVSLRLPLRVEGQFERPEGELAIVATGWRVHARLDGRQLRMKGPDWMRKVTLSADFLDVQRYPDIRFDSQPFEPGLLAAGGPLRGQLQLRGQTREVVFTLLPAGCARPGQDCDIQVQGRLNRHDFGMHAHRFSVRDDISFDFHLRLAEPAQ